MTPNRKDYKQFKIFDYGRTLYWVRGDEEIRVSSKQGQPLFLTLRTLAGEYSRIIGEGGTSAVRQYLGLPQYDSKTKISQQAK